MICISGSGGCFCIDFTATNFFGTYGNCNRAGPGDSNTFCYVKEPSTCSDLKDSIWPLSKYRYSKEACKKTPGTYDS